LRQASLLGLTAEETRQALRRAQEDEPDFSQ
jgi:hypothetical protein